MLLLWYCESSRILLASAGEVYSDFCLKAFADGFSCACGADSVGDAGSAGEAGSTGLVPLVMRVLLVLLVMLILLVMMVPRVMLVSASFC